MDARFKKIVAGETQSAERKFKEPFEIQPFAKILFSANDLYLQRTAPMVTTVGLIY